MAVGERGKGLTVEIVGPVAGTFAIKGGGQGNQFEAPGGRQSGALCFRLCGDVLADGFQTGQQFVGIIAPAAGGDGIGRSVYRV